MFIVSIEGVNGSGKTYLIHKLWKWFIEHTEITTRAVKSPSDTELGKLCREHLLTPPARRSWTEESFHFAILADLKNTIAESRYCDLLFTDRSVFSTLAYCPKKEISNYRHMIRWYFPMPDIVIYLNPENKVIIKNLKNRDQGDTLHCEEKELNKKITELKLRYDNALDYNRQYTLVNSDDTRVYTANNADEALEDFPIIIKKAYEG